MNGRFNERRGAGRGTDWKKQSSTIKPSVSPARCCDNPLINLSVNTHRLSSQCNLSLSLSLWSSRTHTNIQFSRLAPTQLFYINQTVYLSISLPLSFLWEHFPSPHLSHSFPVHSLCFQSHHFFRLFAILNVRPQISKSLLLIWCTASTELILQFLLCNTSVIVKHILHIDSSEATVLGHTVSWLRLAILNWFCNTVSKSFLWVLVPLTGFCVRVCVCVCQWGQKTIKICNKHPSRCHDKQQVFFFITLNQQSAFICE